MILGIFRIIRKDLLEVRLVIIALLVELLTQIALTRAPDPIEPGSLLLASITFLTVFMLAASLVLADSPSSPDAFWKTTPTHPATVFVAKVLGFLLVVLPSLLVAELVALHLNGIPLEQTFAFSFRWTLAVIASVQMIMLIAAVTPNFKSAVSATILFVTFNTLLTNTGSIATLEIEASDVPWLRVTGYAVSIAIVCALYLVYVRKWTADQSRVVAVIALVFIPALHLVFQAGALAVIHRTEVDSHILAAKNYRATVKGDAITIDFAIKVPPRNTTMSLGNVSARIKLADGWYRLGTTATSPGFEKKVGKAFRTGEGRASGLQIGEMTDQSATVDGDSLRIRLNFRFEAVVRDQIQNCDSPVSLSSILMMYAPQTLLNVPADTQYQNGVVPGIDIDVVSIPDSGHWLRVRGRSLGPTGNSVGDAFLHSTSTPLEQRLRMYGGLSMLGVNDTAMLVAESSSDTVRFRRYDTGAGSDDIFLPVPFTVLHDVKVDLKPDSASSKIDLPEFVKHARLIYHGSKYSNHIRLVADVPLGRP